MSRVVARTARLQLRQYTRDDLTALTDLLGDPVTMAHWPAPLTAVQSRDWLQRAMAAYRDRGFGRWAVELHDGTRIGDAGVMCTEVNGVMENDLGYIIQAAHWRRGYGVEAARACLDVARDAGMIRVVANMAADNTGSVRVAQRLGFAQEASFDNPRNRNKETLLFAWHARP